MNISPLHVAGVFLTGGLVTGSYFFYQSVAPSKLEYHLRSLGLELAGKDHWAKKAEEYKNKKSTYPIPTINDQTKQEDVAGKIEKWCEKKKDKYFLGEEDIDYQKFSVWCLAPKKINQVLVARGKTALNDAEKQTKVEEYNQLQEGEKFITVKAPKEGKIIQVSDLTSWCKENEEKDYEHEAIPDFKKVINWCYSK